MLNREQWKKDRLLSIGSSESAGLLGVSNYSSPLSIWTDKSGYEQLENPERDSYMRWGKLLEPIIIQEYQRRCKEELGMDLDVIPFPQDQLIRHPRFPEIPMHATPDAIDSNGRIVEVKLVNQFKADDWYDGIPLKFQVQVQHQMACMEKQGATVVALIGNMDLRPFDIERDDDFIAHLEKTCTEFWEKYVVNDVAPPSDGHKATTEALDRLHPEDNGETIELPPESLEWDQRISEIKEELKSLKDKDLALRNSIKFEIGDNTFGQLPDGDGRWKWATTKRVSKAGKQIKSLKRLNR